jgi:hypothetical protein
MALNGATLGQEIVTALSTIQPGLSSEEQATQLAAWQAIANAIVLHFQTNGVVLTTGTTGSGTPGGPLPITSQPGVIT